MNDGGRIIHIGSTNAERVPFGGAAVYAMSKSALVGLTKGMARDLGPRGITVNNVQPGPVDTEMNPDAGDQLKQLMAIGRYGKDRRSPASSPGRPAGGLYHRRQPEHRRRLLGVTPLKYKKPREGLFVGCKQPDIRTVQIT